ncbi:MAG: iron ABC transporter permease [Rikenellaceae bacterium]
MTNFSKYYIVITLLLLLLFFANIFIGTIKLPVIDILNSIVGGDKDATSLTNIIILESRIPQAITALLTGAALSVSGLMMQTLFANPLASPSIMGISSGSSVGVAVVMLLMGGSVSTITGQMALVFGALIGAIGVLAIIVAFSLRVKNSIMLLIIGIMVGYIANSAVSLLSYVGSSDGVYTYVMWGMGDFSSVSSSNIGYFALFISLALIVSLLTIKPLNALLLGEGYCENLGINIKKARITILVSTGVLTAVITAFCGPISFIGLAAPHIARLVTGTSNHRNLLPITALSGACITLLCNLISTSLLSSIIIPLNVVTPFLGAPVIIYVIINRKKIPYFSD